MSSSQTNLLQGTLDLLILKSLKTGELHGLGVSRRIEQITRGAFQVKPGSLFPALHRLEEAGWLISFWGASENNRRARFYRLTKGGERQLGHEAEEWQKIAVAMSHALKAT
jgi:PadR family transcriptional regulator, regulatory protein PadR